MTNTLETLKELYLKEIKHFEESVDIGSSSISIPRIAAKYQFFYHDSLNAYSLLQDELDELYHSKTFSFKIGQSDLSHISLSSTELKKMIETSVDYRAIVKKQEVIKNDMKLVESMISTITSFNFNITNKIKFESMMNGDM